MAIGSAQRSHTMRDPFTVGERVELVASSLRDVGLSAEHILPIPDLDQYHLWVAQVQAYVPQFDLIVSANPMTANLFEAAGVRVLRMEAQDRERLSGTEVRRRLIAGISVTDLVAPSVAAFLDRPEVHARFEALRKAREGHHG